MATEGELQYFETIGEAGRAHSIGKPFSDANRGGLLLEVGALLSLLPDPPASVLDCGCGTGWLTWLLQRSGYAATGIDVAPLATDLAVANPPYTGMEPPRFVTGDVEGMGFDREFDAVVFFDSLHHVVDEEAALRKVLRALKPGGICVTSEPGDGHADASCHQVEAYGVTERDMPAHHIVSVAKRVGYAKAVTYPRADHVGVRLYGSPPSTDPRWKRTLRGNLVVRSFLTLKTTERARRDNGMVVLTAP
jgi:2-polyprenyl-3-methyl-5-hydroxy-6-metoxy-1,4-benzoquinol methylase